MRLLFTDCETYSEANLKAVGALNYSRHPSTRVTLWTFFEEGWTEAKAVSWTPCLWQAASWAVPRGTRPIVFVHWGAFDRFMARQFALNSSPFRQGPRLDDRLPQALWYGPDVALLDLRQLCFQAGGPADVDHAAAWAGGPKKLPKLETFMKPQKGQRVNPEDEPEKWLRFVEYGKRDAQALHRIALKVWRPAAMVENATGWRVVERMNMRGFPVDRAAVRVARVIVAREEPTLVEEFRRKTGFNPTQVKRLKDLLGLPDCKKDTLLELIADKTASKRSRRLAAIRLEVAGATRHKLRPLIDQAQPDDRCRYQFTYYGAWTRRLTAQATQPQNFHRLDKKNLAKREAFFEALLDWQEGVKIFDGVKQQIRGFVQAPKGRVLVSADFSQIELRVMAWLAGERWLLDALRAGTDVYKITAGEFYQVVAGSVTYEQRAFGKMVELASQFGLSGVGRDGTGGLYAKAKQEKIATSAAEAERAIAVYRRTHPKIVAFWAFMERAVLRCLRTGRTQRVGRIRVEHTQRDLVRLIRPSGQFQCLWDPEIAPGEYRASIRYTGRLKNGAMGRVTTYGSRLAQGVVQGTAADILLHGMVRAEEAGFAPIMSIHDEIVSEIEDPGYDRSKELCEIYCSNIPEWAKGVPIVAEGWQSQRFQ